MRRKHETDFNTWATRPDTTLAGDYHTHGDYSIMTVNGVVRTSDPQNDDYRSEVFDGKDKKNIEASAKGHPGYVGYLGAPSGKFSVYDPATRKVRDLK